MVDVTLEDDEPSKTFYILTEAYYFKDAHREQNLIEEIMVSRKGMCEFAVRWYNLGGRPVTKLEIYGEAIPTFLSMTHFHEWLVEQDGSNFSPAELKEFLVDQGFTDMTPRDYPSSAPESRRLILDTKRAGFYYANDPRRRIMKNIRVSVETYGGEPEYFCYDDEETKPGFKLLFDAEWLKRKIMEDGDEGEIGAGLAAWAMDPTRIAGAVAAGEDPNAIWAEVKLQSCTPRSGLIERNWEAIIAAGLIHDHNEDRGGLYDEYDGEDNDIDSDAEEARRAEREIDKESDRLFAEDMAADRELHTFREGDDFHTKWQTLFGTLPVNPCANYFEHLGDGWKCAVKDDLKNYGSVCGFGTRTILWGYLAAAGVRLGEDD